MLKSTMKNPDLVREACYIGGQWQTAASGRWLTVDNPANGQTIGRLPDCDESDCQRAIEAARLGFQQWRQTSANERSLALYAWGQLMLEQREDLARIITLEQGKPLAEARDEIDYAASFLRWFAEQARRAYGETIPAAKAGQHIVVTRQPVGVTAAITPWNFPSAMITRKAGAALAAGCSMLVKPSEQTPFSAIALAVLAEQAGIPAGVFNVITGQSEPIGRSLCQSPVVRKLSFTGSTRVGSLLMAQSAANIQKVSLELGGNAPFLVFDDADLDQAVAGAMASKFRNSGQTCICTNRFLVQRGVYAAFISKLADAMGQLVSGNGLDHGVNLSALINRQAVEKVIAHYHDAINKGARLVHGPAPDGRNGNLLEPLLLADVSPDMLVCQEETFGPLAAVMPFADEAQAIALANDTPYGLAAYCYSRDIHRAWRLADALEFGMIGINETAISNAAAPFGGVKASGIGREGGHQGMDEFLDDKYLCFGGS